MSLQNISFRQLFQLKSQKFEEYNSLLSHLTPIKLTDSIGSLTDLTFGEVAEIKRSLQKPTFENTIKLFEIIFKIDQKKLYKINVIEFYHALNWIKHEVQSVYNREVENLSPDTDSKLKDAGVDELNIFGEMNTLIALGEKFSKAPQEVENWSYNLVFSLMLHQKISSDINKRYVELNKPVNND